MTFFRNFYDDDDPRKLLEEAVWLHLCYYDKEARSILYKIAKNLDNEPEEKGGTSVDENQETATQGKDEYVQRFV